MNPTRKLQPASAEWTDAFARVLPALPRLEPRKMFGYPAAFSRDHMVAGLHETGLVLRLAEADRAALIAEGGTPFEPMPGRAMRDYVVAPPHFARDDALVRTWLEKALAFVDTKPPKEPKPARQAAGKSAAKRPSAKTSAKPAKPK